MSYIKPCCRNCYFCVYMKNNKYTCDWYKKEVYFPYVDKGCKKFAVKDFHSDDYWLKQQRLEAKNG